MIIVKKIIFSLLCLFVIITVLSGCTLLEDNDGETGYSIKVQNYPLLAYHQEKQIRANFRATYQSWLNLARITENEDDLKKENFQQLISVMRINLENMASEEIIDEYISKLENIDRGGEGEITFPVHEVVHKAQVIEKNDGIISVEISSTRFYPATEWEGEAYNRDYNYIVTLAEKKSIPVVKDVEFI